MKKVLIPTDFSIRSLNMVQHAVNHFPGEKIEIVLFHLLAMPTSITELMLLPRKKNEYYSVVSDEFYEATQVLKNKYASSIGSFTISFQHGSTRAWFNNFLEGRKIDAVVAPGEMQIEPVFKSSINMSRLIEKCKCTVITPRLTHASVAEHVPSMAELLQVAQ